MATYELEGAAAVGDDPDDGSLLTALLFWFCNPCFNHDRRLYSTIPMAITMAMRTPLTTPATTCVELLLLVLPPKVAVELDDEDDDDDDEDDDAVDEEL